MASVFVPRNYVMNDFASARTKMVDSQLRTEDVTDYDVLAVMAEIARERFVPAHLAALAYIDEDLCVLEASATAPARYLMDPARFAKLVQLAAIAKTDHALVVGCGTGYSAAVIGRLARSVVALESDDALAVAAARTLQELGLENVAVVTGPLEAGFPGKGPYDLILLDGAVEFVPEPLLAQLKDGGRLVGVVGYGRSAPAMIYRKAGKEIGARAAFDAAVRPLPGFRKPKTFVF
jgi:protein-L-isoaspartate(D-aspartate) O-methyltransferase